MKKSSIYIKSLLMVLTTATFCGCDNSMTDLDNEVKPQRSESRIEIAGGNPSGTRLSSRTINEPSRPGYCNADRLRIWMYRGVTLETVTPTINDVTFMSESGEIPVTHYSGENNCNKWTSHSYDFTAEGYRNTAFVMPSLAYSAADRDAFTIDVAENGKITDMKLSLTGTATPELYFGRIRFEAYNSKNTDQMQEATDGVFYIKNALSSKPYRDCPATGKLFRIVSQLNVSISKVKDGVVKKMEMYLSNIPTELPLYGNHGAYYPVAAASAHNNSGDILVASTDNFRNGEAKLSTFLLPSAEGRSLKIRIYYAEGAGVDENGNKLTYKDYEIRPSKSFFLTGDDAEVYSAGAVDKLRHGTNLYVYNGTDNLFYSYANVRVNISGDFDRVFTETTVTDVRIEVCPTFERTHSYEIN